MLKLTVTVPEVSIANSTGVMRKTLMAAAAEVASLARAKIRGAQGAGRLYRGSGGSAKYRGYKAGHYTASAPGQPPVSVTGTLARSIKVRPFKSLRTNSPSVSTGVAVRDTAFYALFLEGGARGGFGSGRKGVRGRRNKRTGIAGDRVLQPRPFLTAALAQLAPSLEKRIGEAFVSGLWLRHGQTQGGRDFVQEAVARAQARNTQAAAQQRTLGAIARQQR